MSTQKETEPPVVDPVFEKKYAEVLSIGEECINTSELRNLLLKKPNINYYDGFEPSGRMHIAQGLFKAANVNKATRNDGTFIFWVADWFALMNDKMGGDLERIKIVGEYFTQVWTAAGMDMSKVVFKWSSEEITANADRYWSQVLDIARSFNLTRVQKCCQIMGRKEGTLTAAQILYPVMQSTDVFFLKVDVCQLGVDQRKVNMLARDYCDHAKIKLKPIILSHHMLFGLKKGQAKMSKSDPESAIYMEDSADDVVRKINNAYCPRVGEEKAVTDEESLQLVEDDLMNPCLDYLRYIIFSQPDAKLSVETTEGTLVYDSFEILKEDFLKEKISEADLKTALAAGINLLLEPVRVHFKTDPRSVKLLEHVIEFQRQKTEGGYETSDEVKPTRRLDMSRVIGKSFTAPVAAIFGPLAHPNITVGSTLSLINQLNKIPEGHEIVLVLPDWASFASNSFFGDKKSISAFYTLLIEGIKGLAPGLLDQDNVHVVLQSQAILSDPNEYWISAINVGRKSSLGRILEAIGKTVEDYSVVNAGSIVSAMMFVADVLATGASLVSCDSAFGEGLAKFAVEYINQQEFHDIKAPEIAVVPFADLTLKHQDNIVHGDLDTDLFLLDTSADVNRKLKRSFCEPGNIDFCPTLTLLEHVVLPWSESHSLLIKRKADNGGDMSYDDADKARADFKTEILHPGDFKPSITKAIDAILDRVRNQYKTGPGKKAGAEYKAGIKKLMNKK